MPKRIRIKSDYRMHFVTFSVYKHMPVFRNDFLAQAFLENLKYYCNAEKCKLYGYVIMPDHIHLLITDAEERNISELIRDIKKYFSYKAKNDLLSRSSSNRYQFFCDGKFHFWERGFDEVTVTTEKMFWVKLNYIHNNPVKAELVKKAEDYTYSSASIYMTDSIVKMVI